MCLTKQQKLEIEHTRIFVVEFKQLLIKSCELLKTLFARVKRAVSQSVKWLDRYLHKIQRNYSNMPPTEIYKVVRRLDKSGYSEKEINLMVWGRYHYRNNC